MSAMAPVRTQSLDIAKLKYEIELLSPVGPEASSRFMVLQSPTEAAEVIRIFLSDNTYKSVKITPATLAREVVELLLEKMRLSAPTGSLPPFALFDTAAADFVSSETLLMAHVDRWGDSPAKLFLRRLPIAVDRALLPELTISGHLLSKSRFRKMVRPFRWKKRHIRVATGNLTCCKCCSITRAKSEKKGAAKD